ncbi:NAD(P)/FAD-dependent oxidoreductase [Paenibacillus sp. CAU 1782]
MKCIVIGAGIMGASTAYHLASMGAEVTLIDRQDKGQATDAAAGIICPWVSQRRNKAWYRLASAGARYYPDLIAELEKAGERETGYARVGALLLHDSEDKLAKLEERAKLRREEAPEIGEIASLDGFATKSRFPLLADDYRSVYIEGAARVDGRALRDALVRAAVRHGAMLLRGDAVLDLDTNRVKGVKIGDRAYEGDATIVCAGVWAKELFGQAGISFQVTSQKAQILHLQTQSGHPTKHWPVVMPPTDQYLLAFDHQRLVVGATHENDGVLVDEPVATAGGLQEVLNKGLAVAPGMADSEIVETRVGFRPFTPGFLPIAGKCPGLEGLFAANGLGSSGLTVGPFLGDQLAKLTLGLPFEIDFNDYNLQVAIG